MKSSRAQILGKFHKIPRVRFDGRRLTSFGGAVIFMALFRVMEIRQRLANCFRHLKSSGCYGMPVIVLLLLLHLLLGFRRLRSIDYYRDDELLRHMLGLRSKLPDVSTVSRRMSRADRSAVTNYLRLIKDVFYQRVVVEGFCRLTIDFDGTVLWTRGRAVEGTAVGYNRKRKGARGYYPLLCTCAQTGQVADILFRPGNVHDSNGAIKFMLENVAGLKQLVPGIQIECRFDGAFFEETMLLLLDSLGVEFSISVPFERLYELKGIIEARRRWRRIDGTWSFFEQQWKPKKWERSYRFVFFRQRVARPRRGPVQLELCTPQDHRHEFKVVVTNKQFSAGKLLAFHNGRGSQEGVIGELKQGAQFDYLPFRRQAANEVFLCTSALAHNLSRELQVLAEPRRRRASERRAAAWEFKKLATLREQLLLRAGVLSTPGGELTLTMGRNRAAQAEMEKYLPLLRAA